MSSATPAAATSGVPNDDLLHMIIELNDDSWITLEADGKTVISDELKRKIFWDNPLRFYPRLRGRVENRETISRAAAG